MVTLIMTWARRSREGDNGEIESKDGFKKHVRMFEMYEESEVMTLVKKRREKLLFYTLDASTAFS
jgi:hypothetical protein